jgi:hypothetical protein
VSRTRALIGNFRINPTPIVSHVQRQVSQMPVICFQRAKIQ